MFGGYLILLLTPGYVFLKKIKIKKPPTLGIWKNQNYKIISFGYFKNFKEPSSFMKELENKNNFLSNYLTIS
jgi:hypothetical protein